MKEKDAAVVCAQGWKADKNYLDTWANKYKIPFSMATVEADEEETRLAWGVKSLPWLILTNREHIIKAEGFTLAELGEKLEEVNGE